MGNVIQLRQPPHHDALETQFTTWATKERGLSSTEAQRVFTLVIAADKWLVNETPPPGISILSVTRKDLQAYLFSCEPDPQVRNEIRDALEAFLAWFVVLSLTDENPAQDLPRL